MEEQEEKFSAYTTVPIVATATATATAAAAAGAAAAASCWQGLRQARVVYHDSRPVDLQGLLIRDKIGRLKSEEGTLSAGTSNYKKTNYIKCSGL